MHSWFIKEHEQKLGEVMGQTFYTQWKGRAESRELGRARLRHGSLEGSMYPGVQDCAGFAKSLDCSLYLRGEPLFRGDLHAPDPMLGLWGRV